MTTATKNVCRLLVSLTAASSFIAGLAVPASAMNISGAKGTVASAHVAHTGTLHWTGHSSSKSPSGCGQTHPNNNNNANNFNNNNEASDVFIVNIVKVAA